MKTLTLIIFSLFLGVTVSAQAPLSFRYQAVARNNSGVLLANQPVSFRISILSGGVSGATTYSETHTGLTTNSFGLVELEIGKGIPANGTFSSLNWGSNIYFVKVEMDPVGGSAYQILSISQLLSVPYSLHAKTVETGDNWGSQAVVTDATLSGNGTAATPLKIARQVASNGQVLKFNGSTWAPADIEKSLWSQISNNIYYNAGNVGIGSEADNWQKLKVNGLLGINPGGNTPWGSSILLDASSLTGGLAYMISSLSAGSSEGAGKFQIEGGNSRFIMHNGHIGINTLNPDFSLDVRGLNTDEGGVINVGNSDLSHRLVLFGGRENDPNPYINWKQGDPLRFTTDEGGLSEKMRITSEGKVGIGTSNPTTYIHAHGTPFPSRGQLSLSSPAGEGTFISFYEANIFKAYLWFDVSDQDLRLQNFTAGDLNLNPYGGNVGIGTNIPNSKLDVAGEINVNNNKIRNVADPLNAQDAATKAYVDELFNQGINNGDMFYWNGTEWTIIPVGLNGQILSLVNGVPTWVANNINNLFVSTNEVIDITRNSAKCGGNVLSEGGSSVTVKGVCWNTSGNPTMGDNYTNDGLGVGTFTSSLTNLIPNTNYYVRSYANNDEITAYGNEITFKTLAFESGTFTDSRDGHTYKWVKIGDQIWMAENLAYLPQVNKPLYISSIEPRYCVYGYIGENVSEAKASPNYSTYGVLYNFKAAQGCCPTGWHLPDLEEFNVLCNYLSSSGYNYGGSITGCAENKIAKSLASIKNWSSSLTIGTPGNDSNINNTSGFSALPGGLFADGSGGFDGIGKDGCWYSNNIDGSSGRAFSLYINAWNESISIDGYFGLGSVLSVRCIKD